MDNLRDAPPASPTQSGSAIRQRATAFPPADDGWKWGALAFAVLFLPLVFDLREDAMDHAPPLHLITEALAVAVAASGLGYAMRRLARARWQAQADRRAAEAEAAAQSGAAAAAREEAHSARETAELARETALNAQAQAEAARAATRSMELALAESHRRTAALEAFREATREPNAAIALAIADQFRAWGLTPAEADVARLLLLGLSHKEIAAARDTSERTARDQGQAVYKKAGVAGRAELAAFFLEDLLPLAD